MEEWRFKNGSRSTREHRAASQRKRKGRSMEKGEVEMKKKKGMKMEKKGGEMEKKKGTSRGEILQKKAQPVGRTVVDEGKRGATEGRGFKMEPREEKPGSCCFHILAHTLPEVEEGEEEEGENKEQKSDLMVNEELGQETGSFHFLPLSQLEEEEKGWQEKGEESYSMATLKEEKTCLNRFQILSSALSEELKYELYLVQNL